MFISFFFVMENDICYLIFLLFFDLELIGIIWYLDFIILCIKLGFGYVFLLYFFMNGDVSGG